MLDAIDAEGVTQFNALPETLRAVCELPDVARWDLSSLRDLNSGTSSMSAGEVHAVLDRFGLAGMGMHYGASEAGPISILYAEDCRARPTSVGRPTLNVDVRLVDGAGLDVGPGEIGEIVARSEFLMLGYDGMPEETAAVLRDGWYHTGDLAQADDGGFLFIRGRLKDVIRSGGETILPAEVERCVAELAGVRECAVIGVPDERWGEVPLAAVVLEDGADLDADAIVAHCGDRLAGYKRPRHVRFVDSLPRAEATAKVLKAVLREQLLGPARRS